MEWIIGIVCFLVGGAIGSGATFAISKKPPEVIVVEDKTSQKQQETIKQLTNLDVALSICEKGDQILCREILCLQFTRGIDSQTAGKTCEEISNLANSIKILEECEKRGEEKQNCFDVFWRRK